MRERQSHVGDFSGSMPMISSEEETESIMRTNCAVMAVTIRKKDATARAGFWLLQAYA